MLSASHAKTRQIVVGKGLKIARDQQTFAGEVRTKDSYKSTRRNDGLRLLVYIII